MNPEDYVWDVEYRKPLQMNPGMVRKYPLNAAPKKIEWQILRMSNDEGQFALRLMCVRPYGSYYIDLGPFNYTAMDRNNIAGWLRSARSFLKRQRPKD